MLCVNVGVVLPFSLFFGECLFLKWLSFRHFALLKISFICSSLHLDLKICTKHQTVTIILPTLQEYAIVCRWLLAPCGAHLLRFGYVPVHLLLVLVVKLLFLLLSLVVEDVTWICFGVFTNTNCYRDEKITKSPSIDTRTHIQRDTNEQKDCVNLEYQKINIRFRIQTLSNTLFCLLAKIFGQNKHTRTHILAQSPYNPTNDIKVQQSRE